MIGLLLLASSQCGAQWDQYYAEFKSAFTRNDPPALIALAQGLSDVEDDALKGLAHLSRSAACFRKDNMYCCLKSLEGMPLVTGPERVLLFAQGQKLKAMVSMWRGAPEIAQRQCTEALALLDTILHPEERCDLFITLAEAQRDAGDPESAIKTLGTARTIADGTRYHKGAALVQLNIGNLLFDQGRYEEARRNYIAVLDSATEHGLGMLAVNAVGNIGSTAIMLKDFATAEALLDSLVRSLGIRDPELRGRAISQKGFSASLRGDQTTAIRDLRAAELIQEGVGDSLGSIRTKQYLAVALWETGAKEEAISTMRSTIQLAQTYQQPQVELEARSYLAWWHELRSELALAIEQKDLEMLLSDSLYKARFSDRTALYEVLFESELKEHQIAEQQQALKLSSAEADRRSLQRNILLGATGLLVLLALLLFRTIRTRKRLAGKEKELHDEHVDQLLSQQEIKSINAMLEGQEKERDRMAKDLHDRLGSMLGGIKANVAVLEDRVEQMSHDKQYVKVNKLLDQAVGELRQISHDMAAATLSRFGLEKALKDLRDTIHINGRLSVELKTFGLDHRLDRSIELAVYRMVQELVSNVLKHAQARELSIAVTRSPGRLSVVVADDGRGFDTDAAADGMGLANVRSRASALGATVQVDSTPGRGTTVSVEGPVVE